MNQNLVGVAYFIGNNCLEMAITGSGPLGPGSDAPCYGDEVHRAMYNGWKSEHGTKDQTIYGASGHTWNLGIFSGHFPLNRTTSIC